MSKERNVLAQILKSWAQEHDLNFQISSANSGDEGVDETSSFFSWLIKNTESNVDLVGLLDRLEFYVSNLKSKKLPDGLFCYKCRTFYKYAEPNQSDGTLLCYSCRSSPYI
jgi:hypothetical protein